MEEQEPINMTIKTDKSEHDDRSYSSMSASEDGGCIPRKRVKKKLSETSITGNKITQDQDNKGKNQRLVVAFKEQKIHQY